MRYGRSVIAVGALIAALGDAALYLATAHAGSSGPVAWLFPGLLLLGVGQGLCITPLTTTVLSHADPATAGSVAGALSTAQQVGNSVGVAVTGVLFFGALSHGYGLAFDRSTLQMAALLVVVAALIVPAEGGCGGGDGGAGEVAEAGRGQGAGRGRVAGRTARGEPSGWPARVLGRDHGRAMTPARTDSSRTERLRLDVEGAGLPKGEHGEVA
jgi:MFS family permease